MSPFPQRKVTFNLTLTGMAFVSGFFAQHFVCEIDAFLHVAVSAVFGAVEFRRVTGLQFYFFI